MNPTSSFRVVKYYMVFRNYTNRGHQKPSLTSDTLKLFTDASGVACAGIMDTEWFTVEFPSSWSDTNIAAKELLPIVLAIKLWSRTITNRRIKLYTDNEAVVAVINKTTSRDSLLMSLIRDLVSVCLCKNILFRACHVPGKDNTLADLLSRLQVHRAHQLAPRLAPTPLTVPADWLPWQQQQVT